MSMNPPPRFPFTSAQDALDAVLTDTYWPRLRRYHDHLALWLEQPRPALGAPGALRREEEAAA